MPLNLTTGAELVAAPAFRNRVAMAFYFVARNVFDESSGVPGHEQRERFARSIVLQDLDAFLQYAAMVATNQTIIENGPYDNPATGPTDGQIVAAVTAVWNTLAGVQLLPAAVTDLAGTPDAEAGTVSLDWGAVNGATSYFVYRDDTLLGETTASNFVDEPDPGTYVYTVGAANSAGVGPWSNIAEVTLAESSG